MRSTTPQAPLYAPRLHRNTLVAALQLLSWLLLRPSAWQQHIRRFAPDLAPDFTLLNLRSRHWREPALRWLLTLIYLLWPLLVAFLTAAILWRAGKAGDGILLGALVGFALGSISGLLLGLFLSVAASLSGVIGGGLALGLLVGLVGLPSGFGTAKTEHLVPLSYTSLQVQSPIALSTAVVNSNLTITPQPRTPLLAVSTPVPVAASVQAVTIASAPDMAKAAPTELPVTPVVIVEAAPAGSAEISDAQISVAITSSTVMTQPASQAYSIQVLQSPYATRLSSLPTAVIVWQAGSTEDALTQSGNETAALSPVGALTSPLLTPIAAATIVALPTASGNQSTAAEQGDTALYHIDNFAVTATVAPAIVSPPTVSRLSRLRAIAPLLAGALGFLLIGVMVGVAATIAGSGATSSARRPAPLVWRQQVGSIAVGLLVSAVVIGLALGALRWLRQQPTPDWLAQYGWGGAPLSALLMILGVILLLTLPYQLTKRVAGVWAGGIAGAVGGGGALALLLLRLTDQPLWPRWPLSLLCLAMGLALPLWWPLLHYPLVAAWSALLFRLEQRRNASTALLLPYHPAFWDELQPLPLPALDDYLVLAVERQPAQGKAALHFLGKGRQRWAAQAAQIELDARRLEGCEQVADIPVACRQVVAGELSNAVSALLRTFSRIGADVEGALAQEGLYNQRLALAAVEERLDGLLRELTRSNERYAVRFLAIAEGWWTLVHQAVSDLAAAAELRQEIESPYVIGVPLTAQQEIFVGRADVCERIEQLLRDQRHPPLLLYGQRRMGKTSLLNNLGRLLPNTIVPLFVDLQGPVALAGDHAGFLYNLARTMRESARRQRDLSLPPLLRTELTADPFTRFDEWLSEVEHALGDRTALLALDEFEVLDSAFSAGRLQAEAVLGSLRHWVQHRPRFKILLTGSHVVEELSSWANYLINVQVVHISYLTEAETRRLVEQPVKGFALRYEPSAIQRVWELTHGHPALSQLLCYEIVALKNQQPPETRRLATVADVEAAAFAALEHGALFFHEIETGQLTTAAVALLRWLAGQGEGAIVAVERVQATWPEEVGPAIKLLLRRELIEYFKGGYRFQVELIRRWFAQSHSDD